MKKGYDLFMAEENPIPIRKPLWMFISSVANMKDERDAAEKALEGLEIRGDRFEKWPSTPNDPLKECLEGVGNSDGVILIPGKEYGRKTETGKSSTHEEYLHAIDMRILVFAFIMNAPENEIEPEQNEFIKEVEQGCFHCSKISNIEELKQQIQYSLREEFIRRWRAFRPPQQIETVNQNAAELTRFEDSIEIMKNENIEVGHRATSATFTTNIVLSEDSNEAFEKLKKLDQSNKYSDIHALSKKYEEKFRNDPRIVSLHSTLKCNTKVSDFEGCFEAQALPGSVIKP
jgi:hypothetical protein